MNNNKDKIMLFRKLVVSLIAILALLVIGVIIQGLNSASSGEEKDDSITIIESTTNVETSKTEAVKVDAATEREAEVKDDDNSTVEDASTTSAQDDVITTAEISEEETTAKEEVTAKEEKTTAKEKKTTAAKEENTEAVADYRFRNNKLLSQHYDKHGKEMGFASKEDYEAAAAAVVVNPNALHKTEKEDGDDIYYIEETNEFVVVSTDGYIRTYFNPSGGIKYYNRQ